MHTRSVKHYHKCLYSCLSVISSSLQASSSSSLVKRRSLSCHQGFLSLSAPLVHHSAQHREYPISEQSRPSDTHPEGPRLEWTLPGFISIFLPEFPHRFTGHMHLQVVIGTSHKMWHKSPKNKIPLVVPNPYNYLCSEHKKRHFEEWKSTDETFIQVWNDRVFKWLPFQFCVNCLLFSILLKIVVLSEII